MSVVHMVDAEANTELQLHGPDVRTLCGKHGAPTEGTPARYGLTTEIGSALSATTRRRFVTCAKCNRTLGGSK